MSSRSERLHDTFAWHESLLMPDESEQVPQDVIDRIGARMRETVDNAMFGLIAGKTEEEAQTAMASHHFTQANFTMSSVPLAQHQQLSVTYGQAYSQESYPPHNDSYHLPPPQLGVVMATDVAAWLSDLGVTNARVRVLPPGAADETRQTEAGALTLAHEFSLVMVQHRGELYEWPVQATDETEAHAQFVAWWNSLHQPAEPARRRGMDV